MFTIKKVLVDDIEVIPTKVIYFQHSVQFDVPLWVNWISVDKDGAIYVYENRPEIDDEFECFMHTTGQNEPLDGYNIEYEGDWQESLQYIGG